MTPEITAAEAEFLVQHCARRPGAALLDVPCGDGRLALALARLGCRMTGVDLAAPYIAHARRLGTREGLGLELRRGDMRDLPWRRAFDGAYCMGNSFGYFDRTGCDAFLAAVAATLRPGARFVLDTMCAAESLLPQLDDNAWLAAGESYLLVRNAYDAAESRLDATFTFVQGGKIVTRTAHHWVFTVAELRAMLAAQGLHTLALLSELEGEPFQVGAPRLLLLAEKG